MPDFRQCHECGATGELHRPGCTYEQEPFEVVGEAVYDAATDSLTVTSASLIQRHPWSAQLRSTANSLRDEAEGIDRLADLLDSIQQRRQEEVPRG